jgi:hypothetical protein
MSTKLVVRGKGVFFDYEKFEQENNEQIPGQRDAAPRGP